MPGHAVKARIVAAGLKLGDVADAARVTRASLSNHLYGRRSSLAEQRRIWHAYQWLSGDGVSLETFWGELLSERIAG